MTNSPEPWGDPFEIGVQASLGESFPDPTDPCDITIYVDDAMVQGAFSPDVESGAFFWLNEGPDPQELLQSEIDKRHDEWFYPFRDGWYTFTGVTVYWTGSGEYVEEHIKHNGIRPAFLREVLFAKRDDALAFADSDLVDWIGDAYAEKYERFPV